MRTCECDCGCNETDIPTDYQYENGKRYCNNCANDTHGVRRNLPQCDKCKNRNFMYIPRVISCISYIHIYSRKRDRLCLNCGECKPVD